MVEAEGLAELAPVLDRQRGVPVPFHAALAEEDAVVLLLEQQVVARRLAAGGDEARVLGGLERRRQARSQLEIEQGEDLRPAVVGTDLAHQQDRLSRSQSTATSPVLPAQKASIRPLEAR